MVIDDVQRMNLRNRKNEGGSIFCNDTDFSIIITLFE